MSQELLTPPELETKPPQAKDTDVYRLPELDGSMWVSLISNVRDAFASPKLPPLELTSKPVSDDLMLREEPIWKTLASSIEDLFFPRKLPPLQLTSKAIAVADPMAGQRRVGPGIAALLLVSGFTAAVLFWVTVHVRPVVVKTVPTEVVDLKPYTPIAPRKALTMGGGGGGGDRDLVQVSKGRLPKLAKDQITPPQIVRNDHPKLAVEPTIIMPQPVPLPNTPMPNIGLPTSSQVQLASNGTGHGAGMGSGANGGLGSGNGGGYGPGSGGGTGGGVYHVGGGVSAPSVIFSVEPEFSDEARRAKYQGVVVVSLTVDAQGNPQHIKVVQPLGMGLDEQAIKAIKQYKFKPAYYQGKPVAVADVNMEINFRIY